MRILHRTPRRLITALSVMAATALIGTVIAITASAATYQIPVEAEVGTLATNAKVIADTAASGGQVVRFTEPTATPPTTGQNNCIASPHACGFPDATNTGYIPTGVTLSTYTGDTTIRDDGAVIDGKLINGGLLILASNVTIKRSKIVAHDSWDYSALRIDGDAKNVIIEDTEIDAYHMASAVNSSGTGTIIRRVHAYGSADYFDGDSDFQILDSYGHGRTYTADSHSDGIQTEFGPSNVTIKHNTLVVEGSSSSNAVINIGNNGRSPKNILIQDNLLSGANWLADLAGSSNIGTVSGNRFVRGSYAQGVIRMGGGGTYTWGAGNVWDDNGQAKVCTGNTGNCD